YLHFDDESVAIADQVRTFHGLVESGRVRHLALSNFSPERMREWFETARRESLTVPVAIQPQYNLLHRAEFENAYGPIAREFDVAVFPYFALASGVLTGKYRSAADLEGRARKGMAQSLVTDESLAVIDALESVATAHGAAITSVALAWLLAKGVTAPIASASTAEQVPALIAASRLELTAEEVSTLDAGPQPVARAARGVPGAEWAALGQSVPSERAVGTCRGDVPLPSVSCSPDDAPTPLGTFSRRVASAGRLLPEGGGGRSPSSRGCRQPVAFCRGGMSRSPSLSER